MNAPTYLDDVGAPFAGTAGEFCVDDCFWFAAAEAAGVLGTALDAGATGTEFDVDGGATGAGVAAFEVEGGKPVEEDGTDAGVDAPPGTDGTADPTGAKGAFVEAGAVAGASLKPCIMPPSRIEEPGWCEM